MPNRTSLSLTALEKRALQLQLVSELSAQLHILITHENFYSEVVEMIRRKFDYYAIQLWSRGEDGSAVLMAQSGAYQAHLKIGHRLSLQSGGITSHVISTRKTYVAGDVKNDPLFTSLSFPVESKSQICIPILREGEVLGTLNVESDEPNAFTADDVMTLESVASQVSVTLTNRNLFQATKNFSQELQRAVDDKTRALREAQDRILEQQRLLQKENKALKSLVQKDLHEAQHIIGASPALSSLLQMVDKIAPTTATVLVQGESGTGKELIAIRLHTKSERAERPFVTVNCGALPEALLESELFGHEKGAFTGAVQQKIGLVEAADGGTLFLDEIGEMPLQLQTKLLRFIQEGEFYRLGGKAVHKVNVRLVSATNRDLEGEVRNGKFREDLFYRLNTITLRMPPLRKRREDIPALVEHFFKNPRFGGGKLIQSVDPKAIQALTHYDWPGNIRELQNTVERMRILSENGAISLDDVPLAIQAAAAGAAGETELAGDPSLSLETVEKSHILRALSHFEGNKTRAAQSLGITIKTLYNKLHRYGVMSTQSDETSA